MRIIALILLMTLPASAGQMSSARYGLSGLYHLNEGSGTGITDAVSLGTATITGAVDWVDGKAGKALYFTANEYANLRNIDVSGTELTFGAWAQWWGTAPQGAHPIITKNSGDNGSAGKGFRMLAWSTSTTYGYIESGISNAGFTGCTYGWYAGRDNLPGYYGKWFFLVGTFSNGKYYFYINGKKVCQNLAAKASVANPTSILSIARLTWTVPANMYCGNCKIDSPFVMKKFLTPGEVHRLYTEQLGRHKD